MTSLLFSNDIIFRLFASLAPFLLSFFFFCVFLFPDPFQLANSVVSPFRRRGFSPIPTDSPFAFLSLSVILAFTLPLRLRPGECVLALVRSCLPLYARRGKARYGALSSVLAIKVQG